MENKAELMEDFWPQWKGAVSPVHNTFVPATEPYDQRLKGKNPDDIRPRGDMVNHPPHYCSHPSGVECITITQYMGFNLGNALKYIWRADLKTDAIEDMKKAVFYLNKEIEKRSCKNSPGNS